MSELSNNMGEIFIRQMILCGLESLCMYRESFRQLNILYSIQVGHTICLATVKITISLNICLENISIKGILCYELCRLGIFKAATNKYN